MVYEVSKYCKQSPYEERSKGDGARIYSALVVDYLQLQNPTIKEAQSDSSCKGVSVC